MTREIRLKRDLLFSLAAQGLRYLAPLALYPFLAHKLGAEGFGKFAVYYTAGMIGASLIDFGYGISAVRVLAGSKPGSRTYRSVFANVALGKILNTAILSLAALLWVISFAREDWMLVAASLCLAIGYGHNWNWIYMGTARLPALAAIDTAVSFAQLVLVISLVTPDSGTFFPIVLMTVPVFCAVFTGYALAIKDLPFVWAGRRRFRAYARSSSRVFSMTGIYPLANRMQIIVAGAMVAPQLVGFFAMADRFAVAANGILTPMLRVLMPYIIKLSSSDSDQGASTYKIIAVILPIVTVSGCLVMFFTKDLWFSRVFETFTTKDLMVFYLTLFCIPLSTLNRATGYLKFIPQKREKQYQTYVFTVVALIAAMILPATYVWGIFGIIAARYVAELSLLLLSLRGSNRVAKSK